MTVGNLSALALSVVLLSLILIASHRGPQPAASAFPGKPIFSTICSPGSPEHRDSVSEGDIPACDEAGGEASAPSGRYQALRQGGKYDALKQVDVDKPMTDLGEEGQC